tara:strand:- start:40 stop:8631 length:8592 start_codon:yes stop_codon:yes gene_type:complete
MANYTYNGEPIEESKLLKAAKHHGFSTIQEYIATFEGSEDHVFTMEETSLVFEEEKEAKTDDSAVTDTWWETNAGSKENTVSTSEDTSLGSPDLGLENSVEIEERLEWIKNNPNTRRSSATDNERYEQHVQKLVKEEEQHTINVEKSTSAVLNLEKIINEVSNEDVEKRVVYNYLGAGELVGETELQLSGGDTKNRKLKWQQLGFATYDDYLKNELGEEKYKSFLKYEETGNFEELNIDEKEFDKAKSEVKIKTARDYMANLPPDQRKILKDKTPEFMGLIDTAEKQKQSIEDIAKLRKLNIEVGEQDYKLYQDGVEKYTKSYNDFKKQLITLTNSEEMILPENASSEDISKYNQLLTNLNNVVGEYEKENFSELYNSTIRSQELEGLYIKELTTRLADYKEELQDNSIIGRALGLDYSYTARAGMAMEEFFLGGGYSFGNLTAQVALKGLKALVDDSSFDEEIDTAIASMSQNVVNYNNKLQKKREDKIPDNLEIDDINGGNWFRYGMEVFANNSPSIITALIPGTVAVRGAGIGAKTFATSLARAEALKSQKKYALWAMRTAQANFFVGETGGKYGDMSVEQDFAKKRISTIEELLKSTKNEEERIELTDERQDLERMANYSFAQKAFTSYSFGTIATLAETLGSLKMIQSVGGAARKMGVQEFKEKTYKGSAFNSLMFYKTIEGLSPILTKAIPVELAEESITLLGHNGLDIVVLGEDKSLIEGLNKDFFANTALTSIAIMAPTVGSNTVNLLKNELRIKSEIENNQGLVDELVELYGLEAKTGGQNLKFLRQRKRIVLDKLGLEDAMVIQKLNSLTPEEIKEVFDLNRRVRLINKEIISLGATGETGQTGKDALLRLKKQLDGIQYRRETLLGAKYRKSVQQLKVTKELLNKKLGIEINNDSQNPDALYLYGLNSFYTDSAMTLMSKDGKFIQFGANTGFKTFEEAAKAAGYSEDQINDLKGDFEENENGDPMINGKIYGNDIIINQDAIDMAIFLAPNESAGRFAAMAPLEELYHLNSKAKKGLLDTEGNMILGLEAVDEALDILGNLRSLGKIKEKDYQQILKRFNLYKKGKGKILLDSGKRGKNKLGKDGTDADEILATISNAIGLGILNRSDFNKMTSLKGFINNLIKSTFGDSRWLFELKTGDDVYAFLFNFNENVKDRTTINMQPDDGEESKLSKGEQIVEINISEMSGAIDQYVVGKGFKTNKEFKNNKKAVVGVYEQIEINSVLDGYLSNLIIEDGNISSEQRIDTLRDLKERITERILKSYNPNLDGQERSLFSYIYGKASGRGKGGIAYKALLDIKKAFATKPKTNSTTTITGETFDVIDSSKGSDEILDDKLKARTKLRSKLGQGLKLRGRKLIDIKNAEGFSLQEQVEIAALETFKGKLPDVDSKKFRDFIFNMSADQKNTVRKAIQNRVRSTPDFKQLLKEFLPLYKNYPLSSLVQMDRNNPDKTLIKELKRNLKPKEVDKAIAENKLPKSTSRTSGPTLYEHANPSIEQINDFFFGEDVDTSTRGTRKDAFMKGLATQLMTDMAPSAARKAGVESLKITKMAARLNVDPSIKFNKGERISSLMDGDLENTIYDQASVDSWAKILDTAGIDKADSKAFTVKGSNIKNVTIDYFKTIKTEIPENLIQALDKFTEKMTFSEFNKEFKSLYTIPKFVTIKDKIRKAFFETVKADGDVMKFRTWVKESLTQFLPREFFTGGTFASAGLAGPDRSFFYYSVQSLVDDIDGSNFAKEDKDITAAVTRVGYVKGTGKKRYVDQNWLKNEFKTGKTKILNKKKLKGLKKIFLVFQKMINNNKNSDENLKFIVALLASTSQGMSGFVRTSAPITFVGKILNNGIVEEHTLPASFVAKYLLDSAIKGTIENDFKNIEKSYQQGALSKLDDNKLKGKAIDGEAYNYTEAMPNKWKWTDSVWARYFNLNVGKNKGGINGGNYITDDGSTLFDKLGVDANGFKASPETKKTIKEAVKKNSLGNNFTSPDKTINEQINNIKNYVKAQQKGISLTTPVKKIRVFDFDDTLAKSKSNVLYVMPNGNKGKLNAMEFAKRSEALEVAGAKFDFSEFEKVIDGKKGPLFNLAKKMAEAPGSRDLFVLTARPQTSAPAIYEFLKGVGLEIPLENITGLENGSPQAKGDWIAEKASQGYNDFYFADDAIKNVKAVKNVLDQIDVKSEVQLAKNNKAEKLDLYLNSMIENTTGIESVKDYSAARARAVGSKKGNYSFYIPPSAEDFTGLMYKLYGKGKRGEADMRFVKENLLDPFNKAEAALTQDKISLANDYRALKKQFKTVPKTLKTEAFDGFTYSDAIRVYIWTIQGMEVPGLSKRDSIALVDFVERRRDLLPFANELVVLQKGKQYPGPNENWLAGTITTDVINGIDTVNRSEYLQGWQENVDILFSEKNLRKLEAAYGGKFVEALEDSLRRMKSGSNRAQSNNRVVNELTDWVNNSVGAIMFFNSRSAVLQTLSAVNFINFGDNNILKAGLAFANQPQFWSDFTKLMNSDYLVARRNGLKINVNESEIADAVKTSTNKAKAAIAYLLKKGFLPTQFADSFAIASGGATFYRNKIKRYVKEGMTLELAEQQAFLDFYAVAEETQQSSRTDRISMQQASTAGRVILAFANTPMQYARLQKKAFLDLINGRGNPTAHISKIIYYGAIQNFIFNAMQNALFAMLFDDEDEDEIPRSKKIRIANGMADSQLRGLGIGGAAAATVKNIIVNLYEQSLKKNPKYEDASLELLSFSPPIDSKVTKFRSALRSFSWDSKEIKAKGFSLDNPGLLAGAQILSATTNIPLDRLIKKYNNLRNAGRKDVETWQQIALLSGWSAWELGYKEPKFNALKKKKSIFKKKTKKKSIFNK